MVLQEVFENAVSMRKTVWSKRGEKITRRAVERVVATDVQPRTTIEIKDKNHES